MPSVPESPPPSVCPTLIAEIVNDSPSASVSSALIANNVSAALVIVSPFGTVSVSSTATGFSSLIPVTVKESSAVSVDPLL